jgi:hypothetical protein
MTVQTICEKNEEIFPIFAAKINNNQQLNDSTINN